MEIRGGPTTGSAGRAGPPHRPYGPVLIAGGGAFLVWIAAARVGYRSA